MEETESYEIQNYDSRLFTKCVFLLIQLCVRECNSHLFCGERLSERKPLVRCFLFISFYHNFKQRRKKKKIVIAPATVGSFWWLPVSRAVLYSLPLQSIIIHLIGHVKAPIYRLNVIIILIVDKSCQISK